MTFILIPMRMNLIKAPGEREALGPSPLREVATFPPQADHVLVVFFFIHGGPGGASLKPPDSHFNFEDGIKCATFFGILYFIISRKIKM